MTSIKGEYECVVIGAGPAGAALSAALLRRGVDVLCVDSKAEWTPTYGVWPDELTDLPYEVPYANVWDNVTVSFGSDAQRQIQRPYARVDTPALSSAFFEPLRAQNAFFSGRVSAVRFFPPFFSVEFADSWRLRARFVVDASGHKARFLNRPMGEFAAQTAFGTNVQHDGRSGPLSLKTMGLMLWDDGLVIEGPNGDIPAFVYVMPTSSRVAFVEMTVLAARPFVSIERLRELLDAWLDEHDLKRVEDGAEDERVFIPMGHELPALDQPILGVGGAASEVHPATGYMLTRTLHTAERLADAIAEVRHAVGMEARKQLWRAVWTPQEVRSRALYRFGLEAMLSMGPAQTREFFSAFFDLPDPHWRGYLAGTLSPGELAEVMWVLFRGAPMGLKAQLARTALGKQTPGLLKALLSR